MAGSVRLGGVLPVSLDCFCCSGGWGVRLGGVVPVSWVCFCCSYGWGSETGWCCTCEFGLFLL